MKTIYALFAAATLLAGCCTHPHAAEATQTPVAAAPASPDACGVARFQHLIGTPASAIDRATLPPGTRILTPTSIVTQDFREDRLNIMTGTDGKVSSLRCY